MKYYFSKILPLFVMLVPWNQALAQQRDYGG